MFYWIQKGFIVSLICDGGFVSWISMSIFFFKEALFLTIMATDSDRTINSRFQPRPYYFPINFLFLFEHTSLSLSLSLRWRFGARFHFSAAIFVQHFFSFGDFSNDLKKRKKKQKNILLDIIHPTQSPATHARRWPADRLRRWSFFCFVLLLLLLLLSLLLFYFLRVLVLSAAFPFLFGARESPTHPNPAPCKKTKKQKTKQKNNQYESPRDWCPVFLLSFPFFGFFTCDESQRSILRFFFWRVCFHFYFCSVVGGELLIDDQQWQRTPLFCFFFVFFWGVPSMDLSPGWWTIVPRPYVHQPAPSMSPSSMFVCFFCHLFGFPDFQRPLFFFRYRRLPTRNRFHSIVFLFSIVGFRFTGVQWNPAIVSVLSLLWFDFVDFDEAFYLAWLAFTGFYEV